MQPLQSLFVSAWLAPFRLYQIFILIPNGPKIAHSAVVECLQGFRVGRTVAAALLMLPPNQTWARRGKIDAIDPICELDRLLNDLRLLRNPATSNVLSCLVPSLGRANETALQSRRRTN